MMETNVSLPSSSLDKHTSSKEEEESFGNLLSDVSMKPPTTNSSNDHSYQVNGVTGETSNLSSSDNPTNPNSTDTLTELPNDLPDSLNSLLEVGAGLKFQKLQRNPSTDELLLKDMPLGLTQQSASVPSPIPSPMPQNPIPPTDQSRYGLGQQQVSKRTPQVSLQRDISFREGQLDYLGPSHSGM
jgi:hypothetical protein